jgi:putative two-component system response regulator
MPSGPILCVDDEPNNLALLRQILGNEYKLVFARDGEQALRVAVKHGPSLVLLDVEMPGMDGYEVAAALKADASTEHIPVIFVTALNREVDERAGFACGGVDYITKPVSPFILRARVNTHLSLVRASALSSSYHDAIQMLSVAGHYNDSDTGAHIWRMAAYARVLAEAVGWELPRAKLLEQAAPMHDTGKIGIPDAILKKPGKLDAGEWEIMQRHTLIGFEILSRSKAPLFELAAEIALSHHERWDGTGYPRRLAGSRIPESARIVAVADVFDALASRRPYKEPWPVDAVVEKITEGRGAHFDPHMVDAFRKCLPDILEAKRYWDKREAELTTVTDPHAQVH